LVYRFWEGDVHRRRFLGAAGAIAALLPLQTRSAGAVPDLESGNSFAFEAGKAVPSLDDLIAKELSSRGTLSPYPAEVQKGKDIVAKCPVRQNPLNVAQFFADLRQGELNAGLGSDAHLYGEEWPVRANPVIVSFFDSTTLRTPAGDQTAWCAAFVNWCIVRSRQDRPDAQKLLAHTASAASETFRAWGQKTEAPRPGDIVVFQHKREAWRGHVGFFVSQVGDGIYVLGGNQMPARAKLPDGTYERRNTGEINVSRMRVSGADLNLHSFRTDPSLHDQ
jgi:uncharacterized protein (TIGR02594 family)